MADGAKERLFFGSLELQEKEKLAKGGEDRPAPAPSLSAPADAEFLAFSESATNAAERQQRLLDALEQQKRARTIVVPTKDEAVKKKLRELGEPITLFGENPPDRRNRLKEILARTEGGGAADAPISDDFDANDKPKAELFYTEGPTELRGARLQIARYSIARAKSRVDGERRKREAEESEDMSVQPRAKAPALGEQDLGNELRERVVKFDVAASHIGDDRPVSSIAVSPAGDTIAIGGFSGLIKLWRRAEADSFIVLKGHRDRASGVAWHPGALTTQMSSAVNLVSGSADSTVRLWSLDSASPLATLTGHTDRINRVAVHPMGRYAGSTSNDLTWRLWDLETNKQLLVQEGHSRSVFGIAFQCDGSLAVTTGVDSIGRVWDLRTGKSVVVLQGHVKEVLTVDFHPNGYQLATGSDDNTVRIWDLRRKKSVYTIPAHNSLIPALKFEPTSGHYLVTGSFDHTVKVWSGRDWAPMRTLIGHEDKVTCIDISPNSGYFVSGGRDRTFKIWAR